MYAVHAASSTSAMRKAEAETYERIFLLGQGFTFGADDVTKLV
jgi:hypothetical protein